MEIVLVDVTIRREWMDLKVGDVIKMKKSHPCGTNAWELRRVGDGYPHSLHRMRPIR